MTSFDLDCLGVGTLIFFADLNGDFLEDVGGKLFCSEAAADSIQDSMALGGVDGVA